MCAYLHGKGEIDDGEGENDVEVEEDVRVEDVSVGDAGHELGPAAVLEGHHRQEHCRQGQSKR